MLGGQWGGHAEICTRSITSNTFVKQRQSTKTKLHTKNIIWRPGAETSTLNRLSRFHQGSAFWTQTAKTSLHDRPAASRHRFTRLLRGWKNTQFDDVPRTCSAYSAQPSVAPKICDAGKQKIFAAAFTWNQNCLQWCCRLSASQIPWQLQPSKWTTTKLPLEETPNRVEWNRVI